MKDIVKLFGDFLKDPTMKVFMDEKYKLLNAPTVVYVTVPKKRTLYNIFDIGRLK